MKNTDFFLADTEFVERDLKIEWRQPDLQEKTAFFIRDDDL
jgi:hypothetical protein